MKDQILLVDDSKAIHPLVNTLLAEEPVEIHSAYNGESALTLAASLKPNLILLDVEMPEMDGHEVCRRLKADKSLFNIPVVFLTALSSTDDKVRGLELGAIDYVTKPFNPSELLARVRASLRTQHVIGLLEQRALIDFLTGLGNELMFKQRLAAEVSLRARTSKPLALMAVDVDGFQDINDTYGHPFGDRVLKAIAVKIADVCRIEDVPCRLSGDAFVILTPNTDTEEATLLAKRLNDSLAELKITHQGKPVDVKCSVAIAPSMETYDRLMLERAHKAISESREVGSEDVAMADELWTPVAAS